MYINRSGHILQSVRLSVWTLDRSNWKSSKIKIKHAEQMLFYHFRPISIDKPKNVLLLAK